MDDLDEFYKSYGERLASRLPGIAHSEAQPAFVFVADMENPVEVMSFTSSGKAPAGRPILVWDNFDEDIDTGGRDNYHTQLKCSFSILQKASDAVSKARAYQQARQIILQALSIMISDAQNGELQAQTIQVEIRQLPLEKIGPISSNWYGRGIQFSWIVPIDLTLDPDTVFD